MPIITTLKTFVWSAVMLLAAPLASASPADSTVTRSLPSGERTGPVIVGFVEGAIGPATRNYTARVLAEADEQNASCAILVMDTPGGLSLAMRDIIKDIMASRVPVVVYTAPAGARAASAGALISLASHVAAMAPGTNIGAAHPVSIGGGGDDKNEVMEEKVTNDAAAYARSLATQRGRNVDWAERVVRESISSTPEEALADNVIDLIASSRSELIDALDGFTVDTEFETVTIRTAGSAVIEVRPTTREKFLALISDPNIAYLLMLVGVFGLIFEFQNPGTFFPGIIGVIAIVISTFALQMLPVNLTGLALIILAIIMFVLEVKIPSHGALTVGGVISMLVGSIMLIDSPLPFMRVSLAVIIPSVAFTALFFLFAVGLGIRAQRRKVSTGAQGLVGEVGTARSDVHGRGSVFVHGEYWNAYSDEPVSDGARVEVVSVEGMKLKVRAADTKEV